QLGEHLAVERDPRLGASVDELVVGEAVRASARVDPRDPEPAEDPLALLAVAVRVDERVLDLLLRVAVARVLEAPVALRRLEDLAALLARMDGTLYTGHPSPSIFFTDLRSPGATGSSFPKLRFRFGDLCSRLWLRIDGRRSSFPLAVSLNRFVAALRVLVFGIFSLHPSVLRRAQQHHHVPSVEQRRRLDLADLLYVLRQPHQEVAPALRVGRLAPAEHDRDLHLRALVEEA